MSAEPMPSNSSAQLSDQKVCPPGPPNQGQKKQVSSSSQAFAPASGTQTQDIPHSRVHDYPNQNPDAKGANALPNQPPRMNSETSLQTKSKQNQNTQMKQASRQGYGADNPGAQAHPPSVTASLRSPSLVPETQSSMQVHEMAPAKIGPLPTHPTMQHNAVAWQMHQKKEWKTNVTILNADAKQNSESAGKVQVVGTGKSLANGKKRSHKSTPNANKKSDRQKKLLEVAGSTQPSSKKRKTSKAFQKQSIDPLNDVAAVSGINITEEEEQLLSASKEETLASQEARRIAQEEEEKLFLRKGPLLKKLAEITLKCNLKNISDDVEHCLSMLVEERLRRFISTIIRVSKQRLDAEKIGHRLVITSDVGNQILLMNQKARENWDRKQAEETDKNKKQNEVDDNGGELEKEKEEVRPKNVKVTSLMEFLCSGSSLADTRCLSQLNKDEDDKMRMIAANVAARQAVGGSDDFSRFQLMAEQNRQKREGVGVAAASQAGSGPLSNFGKGPGEHQGGSKRSYSAAFGCGGVKRPVRAFVGPPRTISMKDVICALEREPKMTKSRLIYQLYERLPGGHRGAGSISHAR